MMGEGWGLYGGPQGTLDKKKMKMNFCKIRKRLCEIPSYICGISQK